MMRGEGAGLAILVVDDSPDIRTLIERELRPLARKVVGVENAQDAKAILTEAYFDLVISDMLLPDGDGLEVIAEAKRRYPSVRILAITGGGLYLSDDYCAHLAKQMGAHAVLFKPFVPSQLTRAIKAIMPSAG